MKSFGSLDNYIEMHRLRGGLSQDDLAYLISVEARGAVSHFEHGVRLPNLEALIALEIVFEQPIQEIYGGIAERIRATVTERAHLLLESLDDEPSKELALKIELLSRIIRADEPSIIPIWPEE